MPWGIRLARMGLIDHESVNKCAVSKQHLTLEGLGFRVARIVGYAESILVMAFATFLVVAIGLFIFVGFVIDWARASRPERILLCVLAITWLLLDFPYLTRLWRAAEKNQFPLALAAVRGQIMAPLVLRVPVAIWWLAHFSVGGLGALLADQLRRDHLPLPLVVFFAFCCGVLANGFFIQALGSITASDALRRTAWRWRWLVDVGLAIAGFILSKTHVFDPIK